MQRVGLKFPSSSNVHVVSGRDANSNADERSSEEDNDDGANQAAWNVQIHETPMQVKMGSLTRVDSQDDGNGNL